jgi:poly-gamma-glutamate capsule biosynthesis protein CapA/YwtB (metallophosphatase superfamily)
MDKFIPEEFNTPVRTFASGYNWKEKLAFIKNRIKPSRKYDQLTTALGKKTTLNDGVNTQIKIGFTGDVMPIKDYKLVIAADIKQFYSGLDYVLVNMEGVITEQHRMLALSHRRTIVKYLADMFPLEKTIVYVANNHAGDFGYQTFKDQYAWLKDHFGCVIGAHDEAATRIGSVNIAAVTGLSNQICHYVPWLKDADQWHDPTADFNLLLPHWGYELQLYPHPKQIEMAKDLLQKWNFIAGNHSHCPQPAAAYRVGEERRGVIYSMGNFCYHHRWPNHRFGKIAKLEIGKNATNQWQAGQLEWAFTRHDVVKNNEMLVQITPKVQY